MIDQCGFARKRTNSIRLVGSSVAKTVAANNTPTAGTFGPGFPAKGMTASANIAYVQMKAILIVKAERAGALRALMRSLSAPLLYALISSPPQSLWGAEFSTYSCETARFRPTVRRAAAASCLHAHRELLCRARSADGPNATCRPRAPMSA